MKKTIYVRPKIDKLTIDTSCSLLGLSRQTPWADAKRHDPNFSTGLWDDEFDDTSDEDANWAGYQQNMSIW